MLPASTPEPMAFSVKDLPAIISVGRSTVNSLIKTGALPSRKLGTRTIVLREDVAAYLRSLPMQVAA